MDAKTDFAARWMAVFTDATRTSSASPPRIA